MTAARLREGTLSGVAALAISSSLWGLGCANSADDTAGAGTSSATDIDPCETQATAAGSSVGEASCSDDVCEVAVGSAWRGEASPDTPDRCPVHQVDLAAFGIGQTEVTVASWEACVDAGQCASQPAWCAPAADRSDRGELPVTCLTWQQATDFCSLQGGNLPTEAQWEVAARGRDLAPWPWGDGYAPSCNFVNFRFVSSYCVGEPLAVGSLAWGDSPFGLADMSGNVWEWTADWYDAGWYPDAPRQDPTGPEECRDHPDDPLGDCTERVIRGGAWNTTQETISPASRSHANPALIDNNVGFRCAWSR